MSTKSNGSAGATTKTDATTPDQPSAKTGNFGHSNQPIVITGLARFGFWMFVAVFSTSLVAASAWLSVEGKTALSIAFFVMAIIPLMGMIGGFSARTKYTRINGNVSYEE